MESKIIEILKKHNHKIMLDKLLSKFKTIDHVDVKNSLDNLAEENKIAISNSNHIYLLDDKYKQGILKLNPKGFGFVNDLLNEDQEDYFVAPVDLNGCFGTDQVVYTVVDDQDNRTKAVICELVKREKIFLIGEIVRSYDKKFLDFIPTDKSFDNFRFVILNKAEFKYEEYQLIKAKIINVKDRKIFIRLQKVVGDIRKASDRIIAIAEEFEIKTEFNHNTLKDAELVNIPVDKQTDELKKRQKNSLVDKMIVTIDGIDSKDLDDAICVEKLDNGHYKLYVAIADVSYYVKPKTSLDNEALFRGNSTYLANKVIPMLPKVLSDDLCSLNPNTKKFTMACEMEFDSNGIMLSKKVYETVIISKFRLNYKEVNEYFENKTWNHDSESKQMIDNAYELYKKIEAYKVKRGTINFEVREPKIIMDKDSKVIDITARTTGESEKLIEQFMVSANEAVAELIYEKELPFIYRNHGKPDEQELITWYQSLKSFGIDPKLTPLEMLDPKNINRTLSQIEKQIKDPVEVELLNISLLKYMDKAKYGLENIGHFGLSSECYTHFTSPIRRYSDLMVHRYLKQYLLEKDTRKFVLESNQNFITKACNIINETETTSVDCEREVIKACMAEFMADKVNSTYTGTIAAVLKFGMFVQLDNMVEGLVHISNMDNNLVYDEENKILIKPDNTYYRMGQKVKVKLINADVKKRAIDFVLVQ
ncbi:Ribonuclease R [Mycoplasma yeatsii 13926]|uniref:Ribonuclease R n=1 Tax=Mycoplasma yeatsii 13926 TaxID=1188240 RepID=S6G896_9MOLU|nr:ribonuclease R [Mycoplasma yeatsii]EOA06955.1 Ribonuclease R [Mycoplasma yeatsii 13926]